MKNIKPFLFFILSIISTTDILFSRGGGGCVEKGSLIDTVRGKIKIQDIKKGDIVITNKKKLSEVQSVYGTESEDIIEIKACGKTIRSTPDHPFMISAGIFKEALYFKKGDWIYLEGFKCKIEKLQKKKENTNVYNLLVFPAQSYLANGFAVHNKGCFLPDTFILKSDGTQARISEIKQGDEIISFDKEGKKTFSKVYEIIKLKTDEYFELKTEKITLYATAEHPFYVGNGVFKNLENLKIGDKIYYFDGEGLSKTEIKSLKKIKRQADIYNLKVSNPNTFFANYVAVHNKGGGCFPKGTKIKTERGEKNIEEIKENEIVISYEKGNLLKSRVTEIHKTKDTIIEITAEIGKLRTTSEHPLLTRKGFIKAENITEKDELLYYDKNFKWVKIKKINRNDSMEEVYNLSVSYPNTFIAEGFVVHNKGGFGSRSYSRGGNGKYEKDNPFFLLIIIGIILVSIFRKNDEDENLDFIFSDGEIKKKSQKTEKIIEFISKTDKTLEINSLKNRVSEVFTKLQNCWQNRNYEPLAPDISAHLFNQHLIQIEMMKKSHEINIIDNLKIISIDIVGLRYTHKKDSNFFTALITASAKDYYIDDRTNEFLRGDDKPQLFQEFWTFKYENEKWVLYKIEQTSESDILNKEDFIEQFTDEQVKQIIGEIPAKLGPVGPTAEDKVVSKKEKIARLLNFLYETDKMWNMGRMEIDSSLAFINVYRAWSFLDPQKISDEYVTVEMKKNITELIEEKRKEGYSFEFRNLCIREVSIVLVNNMIDNGKDEFAVRFSAHAQKIVKRNENVIIFDEYVKPFTEYWVFGRENNKWKLKEILPRGKGENVLNEENKDEDSSPAQLEWYYTKKRTY